MASDVWTDTVYDRLKELCELPISNAIIAQKLTDEFHVYFTRNSIIGKRLRCGLNGPPREKKAAQQRLRSATRHARPRLRAAPRPSPLVVNGFHPEMPTVFPDACDLLSLTNTSCRYPCGEVGKPGFFFCGTPEADFIGGHPYCIAHSWIVVRG